MSAQPVHEEDPRDPRDPRAILADLPEHARPNFLAQYRAAVETAQDPARYAELKTLLRIWAVRVKVYRKHPNYDEEAEARSAEVRSGAAATVSMEEALAFGYGITIEEATEKWEQARAEARAGRQRRTA
jgi:hypothetical protein